MNSGTIFAIKIGIATAIVISVIFLLKRYRRKAALSLEESLKVPVGIALAEQVASCLKAGSEIAHNHRDSCGMGLCFIEEKYVYGPVYDGDFLWPGGQGNTLAFSSEKDFVLWLATQSDRTFGAETSTQSMTRARLTAAVEHCSLNQNERA